MDIRNTPLVQEATVARRSTPLVVAWLVAFGLGVIVVAQMLVDPFAWSMLGYPDYGTPLSELVLLFTNLATLLVLAAWLWLWEGRPFRTIGLSRGDALHGLVIGFLAGCALFALPTLGLIAAGQIGPGNPLAMESTGWAALPIALAFLPVWLIESGAEEAVMRGYLLQRHALKLPAWPAILVVSVGFALAHLDPEPVVLVNTALFSMGLCFVALAQGSLWSCIGIHAGWNMTQGQIFGLPVSGTALTNSLFSFAPTQGSRPLLTGGNYGVEGSIPVTVALALACVAAYYYFRRVSEPASNSGGDPAS